jgi:glycerol-3-phosphate dehydrogenase
VRAGLLLPDGGASLLPRLREVCREELAWDDERWSMEEHDYLARWSASYAVPAGPAGLAAPAADAVPALCA